MVEKDYQLGYPSEEQDDEWLDPELEALLREATTVVITDADLARMKKRLFDAIDAEQVHLYTESNGETSKLKK